jgi:hypothetical protein
MSICCYDGDAIHDWQDIPLSPLTDKDRIEALRSGCLSVAMKRIFFSFPCRNSFCTCQLS